MHRAARARRPRSRPRLVPRELAGAALRCQYLYLCTSTASELSTCSRPTTPLSSQPFMTSLRDSCASSVCAPGTQILRCQYLYFCTSKASKLSTWCVRAAKPEALACYGVARVRSVHVGIHLGNRHIQVEILLRDRTCQEDHEHREGCTNSGKSAISLHSKIVTQYKVSYLVTWCNYLSVNGAIGLFFRIS